MIKTSTEVSVPGVRKMAAVKRRIALRSASAMGGIILGTSELAKPVVAGMALRSLGAWALYRLAMAIIEELRSA